MIDFFVDISNQELTDMVMLTEVINKFEKLRIEANKKIQAAKEKDEQPDSSPLLALTLGQSETLKYLFNQLRFVFARFSKIINYINRLKIGWKGYQMKLDLQSESSRTPI